jgi:MarR family transcriptional regulator, organic hydroperoxide resistance regulator
MSEVYKAARPYMEAVTAEFDLTPQQAWALKQLSSDKPRAMSDLAESLMCDASSVTWIADRLEERGLVERRSTEHDRRVKALVITKDGAALQRKLVARMHQPPPVIANLSREDQRTLRDLLRRALDSLAD